MEKIFYGKRTDFADGENFVRAIFSEFFSLGEIRIVRSETGKPFLDGNPYFFSVAHTDERIFAAISDENIGIDAEKFSRTIDYEIVAKRFFSRGERQETRSKEDFLRLWTAKESAIKWLGGTLARDLKKTTFVGGQIFRRDLPLPLSLSFFEKDGHIVALCREKAAEETPFVFFHSPFPSYSV